MAAPSPCTVKLNTNGSFHEDRRRMGYGGVVRKSSGNWVTRFLAGASGGDALMAELLALRYGLQLVWESGMRVVMCEIDCLEIIDTLQGDRIDFHELAAEFVEVRSLLQQDWEVQLLHIPRSANDVADCLAGLGATPQCALLHLDTPPMEVDPILARDFLAL
ncbi:uncharacterized protein LOC130734560 [Lotus japonicus]|uniref:uncharacterized protein LOC130734560 n=1 Tax=Lotus japonicus TaxID=34305 RepID=UPI0025859202|nr:uncharacterized protein LOC130734560 [Lotus japonicus]